FPAEPASVPTFTTPSLTFSAALLPLVCAASMFIVPGPDLVSVTLAWMENTPVLSVSPLSRFKNPVTGNVAAVNVRPVVVITRFERAVAPGMSSSEVAIVCVAVAAPGTTSGVNDATYDRGDDPGAT